MNTKLAFDELLKTLTKAADEGTNTYMLNVAINNVAGAIAKVTTLLSENDINISNLFVSDSEHTKQGTLRMIFEDQELLMQANDVLKENGLQTYIRK